MSTAGEPATLILEKMKPELQVLDRDKADLSDDFLAWVGFDVFHECIRFRGRFVGRVKIAKARECVLLGVLTNRLDAIDDNGFGTRRFGISKTDVTDAIFVLGNS